MDRTNDSQTTHDDIEAKAPVTGDLTESEPLATDAEEAIHTLDDTSFRPLPEVTAYWEALDAVPAPGSAPEPAPAPKAGIPRGRVAALVCAVSVVSFVAGGLTARLSSQVPVLFAQRGAQEETARQATPLAANAPEQQLPEEQPLPTDEAPTYEPVDDTTDDTSDYTPIDAPVTDETGDADDPSLQWNLDDQGDRSVSYDLERNRVTLDYDGYTLSIPVDGTDGVSDELNSWNDTYGDRSDAIREQDVYNRYDYRFDSSDGWGGGTDRTYYDWNGWSVGGGSRT